MHELDPSWLGLPSWEEVRSWRKQQRAALIAQRLALTAALRHEHEAAVTEHIRSAVPDLALRHVGFFWPFKGEYDPRPLARTLHASGTRLALPVVERRAAPLVFRSWQPSARMALGVWNIPIPADGEVVTPDVLLVPLVGFDAGGYGLGYGGGYYDRTLAALTPRPLTVGIGFEASRLTTIHPQTHDVPMDIIVTEAGANDVGAVEPARPACSLPTNPSRDA
jgi:5-formyltetrahydrofolate cyclo-ligase